MPKIPHRPLIGLAIALLLALVVRPESAGGSATGDSAVRTASVTDPVVVPMSIIDLDEAARTAPALDTTGEPPTPAAAPPVTTTTTTAPPPPPAPEPVAAPAPAPPPPPPSAPGTIEEIIERHFGAAAEQAKRVAYCESKMDPNAVSRTNDHGLFQINHVHRGQFEAVTGHPWSEIYNPELNTMYAKWLYDQDGWRPWSCRGAA